MRYRHLMTPHAPRGSQPPDLVLLSAIGALVVFGLLALASASGYYSFQRYGSWYRVVLYQIAVGGIPGAMLGYFFYRVDYHRWRQWWGWLLCGTLALLSLVFVPGIGQEYNHARSWAVIGPVNFQPAEIAKFSAILFLAAWLSRSGYQQVRSFGQGFLPFAVALGLICGLIALQPDFGTMLVVFVVMISMYFAAGARWLHLGFLGGLAVAGIIFLLMTGGGPAKRIEAFLNSGTGVQGSSYHVQQAYLAVGSGGWFGRGFGKSHQKYAYLPEVSADSIFAIIAEELGFVVTSLLVVLLTFVILRSLMISKIAADPYGRFLAVGVATWFGFQSFLNIAVMVGLAPLTGIPLPFISAGGTALASNLAAAGLLLNISRFTPKT